MYCIELIENVCILKSQGSAVNISLISGEDVANFANGINYYSIFAKINYVPLFNWWEENIKKFLCSFLLVLDLLERLPYLLWSLR